MRSRWSVVSRSTASSPTGNSLQEVGLLGTLWAPIDGDDLSRMQARSSVARSGPTSITVAGFSLVLGIECKGDAADQAYAADGAWRGGTPWLIWADLLGGTCTLTDVTGWPGTSWHPAC